MRRRKPLSIISQNIADSPRTDAGVKGMPAKEFRKKWMISGVSDVPSLPDQKRSTAERF